MPFWWKLPGAGPGKNVETMREGGLLEYLIVEEYTPEILPKIRKTLEAHGTHRISQAAHGLFAASAAKTVHVGTGQDLSVLATSQDLPSRDHRFAMHAESIIWSRAFGCFPDFRE